MTLNRGRQVLDLVTAMGKAGATVADVEEMTGLHHGAASSALSKLNRDGDLVRLAERRDGRGVYVLPDDAGDRALAQPRVNKHRRVLDALAVQAEQARRRADVCSMRGLGKAVVDTHLEYADRLTDIIEQEEGSKS